ncbi:hypothetical protein QBZ16_001762 [Prototheca wickerhamii]|uniref:CHRD domain-containing protein n=1 Tax=Prototheca wickerhamii TaxID=3111 RepID=A0AAD9IEM4_PROWI|nr:hypothetical protein QBZ16_001762 [Prototheca wickerhamii]
MMMTFVSELYAENQVPPLTERDVDDAEAKLKLWSTPQGYRWKFEISDVVNMTMAHIHMGNSSTNGPVIVPILPLNASMSEFADGNLAMISPPISGDFEYEGLITTDNFLGPLEGMTLDDFMMVLMSGDAYANIHSVEYPAGLIRGQFEVDH